MGKDLKIDDLKAADYNPRSITEKQLEDLSDSIARFGDLSGIVYNKRTGVLVSGHQRVNSIRKAGHKTRVNVTKQKKDKYGTIAQGFLEFKTKKGIVQIPMRVVDWSSSISEKVANIAANAHGGAFDQGKLGTILAELNESSLTSSVLGLDAITIKTLLPKALPTLEEKESSEGSGDEESFEVFDEDEMTFEHCCPKCKYRW